MNKNPKINELLDQIIEYAEEEDLHRKQDPNLPLEKKIGKSWLVFHLEQLRVLINSNN